MHSPTRCYIKVRKTGDIKRDAEIALSKFRKKVKSTKVLVEHIDNMFYRKPSEIKRASKKRALRLAEKNKFL
mgnify:CR=1 FL=1